ncbi:MAG: hypothetical protein HQK65_01005 [Desulfamplus sp.]|nr:hypothetical protein [Desulfamplus sp.]
MNHVRIQLVPDAGWAWQGWNGILDIQNKQIITNTDIASTTYTPKQYTATGFYDMPGMISSVTFLLSDDPAKKDNQTFSEGKFTAIVGPPSMKATPGGPVPDPIPLKTGIWKILSI